MDEYLRDRLINIVAKYVNQDDLENIKMLFDVALSKYDIKKKTTEVIPYSGNINDQVLMKFLCSKIARGCSPRTVKYYKDTIRNTLQTIGKNYADITPDDIRIYIATRVQRDGVSKTTINNERRNLSSFYGWLQREDILLRNPMLKVEKIKTRKEKKKAFTLVEMEKIRAACRTARERAMVEMLFSTWCRVSELISIKVADFNGPKCSVHGKGDKIREVYLNARAQIAVESYLAERKDTNPYLFPGGVTDYVRPTGRKAGCYSKEWYKNPKLVSPDEPVRDSSVEAACRKLGKAAGVENVHPHRFRRTGATMALRAGMPLVQVSKLLGHESVETTQIYLDITEEELETAHEKYVV